MGRTLIVFAHGSGNGKGHFTVPQTLVVTSYAPTLQNIYASDARLIFNSVRTEGKALPRIAHLTEHPYQTRMPNFPLNFHDHNEVGKSAGLPLGVYWVDDTQPGQLHPFHNPWKDKRVHVQDVANHFSAGCTKMVLVSCNGAPSFTVVGHHVGHVCPGPVKCVNEVGPAGSYADLNITPFLCDTCGHCFEPEVFTFKDCHFRFKGTLRPRGEEFSLGPDGIKGASNEWIDCTGTETVDVSLSPVAGGIMTLELQTR
jgi:hypothetical protein